MSTFLKSLLVVTVVLACLVSSNAARADQNPATDDVVNLFPYTGTLEKDGQSVSGSVEMEFALYDARGASGTPIWIETQQVEVYRGRFTVLLGLCDQDPDPSTTCPNGGVNTTDIEGVIRYADDLSLGIRLFPGSTSIDLQNRKRFLPVPYAVWTRAASDLEVARDLTVRRNAAVTGSATIGADLTVTRNLTVSGSATFQRPCRAGYMAISGFCMSSNPLRTATGVIEAAGACADEGGHVCSTGEYYKAAAVLGYNPCVDASTPCWTDGLCDALQGVYVRVSWGWGCAWYSDAKQYRCCHSR